MSWDHFFTSMQQYFSNLRQEQTPPTMMGYTPNGALAQPALMGDPAYYR